MLNACCFEGRIASTPVVRGDEHKGLYFNLAVRRNFKNRETEETEADFLPVVCFHMAEHYEKYLSKGDLITIFAEAVSYKKDKVEKIIFKTRQLNFVYLKKFNKDGEQEIPEDAELLDADEEYDGDMDELPFD